MGYEFVQPHAKKFATLFKGRSDCYGVHQPDPKAEGQKSKGTSWTKQEVLTDNLYLQHVVGKTSIGVVPVTENGTLHFAAIDIDTYPSEPMKYINLLRKYSLPFVAFRSKSGGLHLYIFFSDEPKVSKVLPLLGTIRQVLGLPATTEIFPKQKVVAAGKVGSWINLPYYKHNSTVRYAYDDEGGALDLMAALNLCTAYKTTLTNLTTLVEALPLMDGPPCLQTLFLQGGAFKGTRNLFLFNCATYLKAKYGDEFADELYNLNLKTEEPLPGEELEHTIISSHQKGDYSYQCNEPLFSAYCDRAACAEREYGKGGSSVSDFSFEQLTQVNSRTPYYKWRISGVDMVFYSENELLKQEKFRALCMRHLHKIPNRLKDVKWTSVLNRALSNILIEDADNQDDLSPDSLWLGKVSDFLSKGRARRPSQVLEGLVWEELGVLQFRADKLLEFLDKTGLFRNFKPMQHRELLKDLGASQRKLRCKDLKRSLRVWTIELENAHKDGLLLGVSSGQEDDFEELDFTQKELF